MLEYLIIWHNHKTIVVFIILFWMYRRPEVVSLVVVLSVFMGKVNIGLQIDEFTAFSHQRLIEIHEESPFPLEERPEIVLVVFEERT